VEIQLIVTRSGRNNFYCLAFLILVCVGLVIVSSGALAGPIASPYAKPVSDRALVIDGGAAPGGSVDVELTTTEEHGSDQIDHEADDGRIGHNHAESQQTGLPIRLDLVGDLKDHSSTGRETPTDLQALLVPGTIIHFWASWCRPCEEEFPQLDRFHRAHISKNPGETDIRLITISNDFTAAPAARFIEKHGVSFPVYLDTDQASNLVIVGKRELPATVMIGADGRFHRLALGKLDWDYPRLPDVLAAIAAPKPETGNNSRHTQQGNK
jgi:thiol-disulfide isomerase/thioredoxin